MKGLQPIYSSYSTTVVHQLDLLWSTSLRLAWARLFIFLFLIFARARRPQRVASLGLTVVKSQGYRDYMHWHGTPTQSTFLHATYLLHTLDSTPSSISVSNPQSLIMDFESEARPQSPPLISNGHHQNQCPTPSLIPPSVPLNDPYEESPAHFPLCLNAAADSSDCWSPRIGHF